MKAVFAIDDAGTARRGARKLDGAFHGFRTGVDKECFFQMRHACDKFFCEQAGERRHIELDKTRQVSVEYALERVADDWMIAANRKGAETAQQIEITFAIAVIEIRPFGAAEADVIADGSQHADHLIIEVPAVERVSVAFAARI